MNRVNSSFHSFISKSGLKVELTKFEECYLEEIVQMMAESQSKNHPWFIIADLDKELWKAFLREFLNEAVFQENYHIVALVDDKVVGFAGLNDIKKQSYPKCEKINLGLQWETQISTYIKYPGLNDLINNEDCLYLFWVAVDNSFAGNGIGKVLFSGYKYYKGLEHYKYLYTDPASAASHSICKQLGFKFLRTTKCEDMKTSTGIKPFIGMHKKLEEAGLPSNNDEFSNCLLKL